MNFISLKKVVVISDRVEAILAKKGMINTHLRQ
jgi:hypothetical protein